MFNNRRCFGGFDRGYELVRSRECLGRKWRGGLKIKTNVYFLPGFLLLVFSIFVRPHHHLLLKQLHYKDGRWRRDRREASTWGKRYCCPCGRCMVTSLSHERHAGLESVDLVERLTTSRMRKQNARFSFRIARPVRARTACRRN